MPSRPDSNATGGTHFHKPGCKCNPCKARARAETSLVNSSRDARHLADSEETINADLPELITRKRSIRAHVADWVQIRSLEPGITNIEVAKRLGISVGHLNTILSRANKEGWLKFEDPIAKLEYEIVPKVVDNLNYFLDAKDRTVTIETAKGTIFRQFQEVKGISDAPKTVLAIKLELPEGLVQPSPGTGRIVGAPRQIVEGEIITHD